MISNISGFPEFLPPQQIAFDRVIRVIKHKFEQYGFIPLDTAAVERSETLLSKGNDNEIYGLVRIAEGASAKCELGLRFDLTVPLARYVAQNYGQLVFPYRRYHIAPVWRGERPQAGRYRQFYQCDIDIIGDGELALLHDAEILAIICDVFNSIGVPKFTIKINSRKLLSGLIQSLGIDKDGVAQVMRIIDKAEKISSEQFAAELAATGVNEAGIKLINSLIQQKYNNQEWISYLRALSDNTEFQQGIDEIAQILDAALSFGADNHKIVIDPTLARGLAYYTGIVYETKLDECPELGSVCGGGRYANLAGSFTNKELPGVGISIGISRLIPKMLEMGLLQGGSWAIAQVLVTTQDHTRMTDYAAIAKELRDAGIATELYLQQKALGAQMKYASKKGFAMAIIADSQELDAGCVNLRMLHNSEQKKIKRTDLVQTVSGS
ncbi:MAG: histidine--tRNA ligase [Proteobacteria bacterium]|nr:histidine--tRNA ligase [Pseudomonadota bacterium]